MRQLPPEARCLTAGGAALTGEAVQISWTTIGRRCRRTLIDESVMLVKSAGSLASRLVSGEGDDRDVAAGPTGERVPNERTSMSARPRHATSVASQLIS